MISVEMPTGEQTGSREPSMRMYEQDEALVEAWQCRDPALTNVTDLIMGIVRPLSGRALDVGCGTGRLSVRLAQQGFRVEALDVEEKAVKIARKVAERLGLAICFRVCDFACEQGTFGNEAYDLVVCMEVLEHILDWRPVVLAMCRVLRPGGTLIITVPHNPRLFSVIDEHAGHYRRYHAQDILAMLPGYETRYFTTGFPFVRSVTWAYTSVLKLTRREHRPQTLWQEGSLYRSIGWRILYFLDKADNLFNRLNMGMTLVVHATKPVER